MAILISNNIDFSLEKIRRDSEGHFLIIKGYVHQEEITLLNTYEPNVGASKYLKLLLTDFKKDTGSNTILSPLDTSR